jgi:6-pyruvoyltetrahydropterin/6-carboxytetrahydropterin synthase
MFYLKKTMEVSGSHQLELDYPSACSQLHGHNWFITIYCASHTLNHNGMIEDFVDIKKAIHGKLDHAHINDVVDFNPTAENIAKWCVEQIPSCYRADVQETTGNIATYHVDPKDPRYNVIQ